eukprot:gene10061-11903_t
MAYACILVAWFMCAWSLLTFSMLIREMMGSKAEQELIASWAEVLAVEMFGKEAIKLICVRLFVDGLMQKAESAWPWRAASRVLQTVNAVSAQFAPQKAAPEELIAFQFVFPRDHPAFPWYEKYIMTVIMANAKDADDTGDQDMGDDADADGGGDDEVAGGDDEAGGAEIDI